MNAYCINLKERKDRWELFNSQDIPFAVERFEGIKAKSGSLGCILSHLEVMKKCNGEIMILEDDCKFLLDWKVFYDAYNQLPDDWDVLYLGANLHEPLERHSDNLFRLKRGWSTHGILYKRRVINMILDDGEKIIKTHKNIDTYMVRRVQPFNNCFIVYPLFSVQRPGHSDIINGFRSYDEMEGNFEKYTHEGIKERIK